MIKIERFYIGHMLVAVAALAIGLAISKSGSYFCSLLIVLLGVVWFAFQQRGTPGGEGIMLFLFILSAAIGFFVGAPTWVMLIGVVSSLGAWDLDHFLQRLNRADRVELELGLGREHLRRLLFVEGIGSQQGWLL